MSPTSVRSYYVLEFTPSNEEVLHCIRDVYKAVGPGGPGSISPRPQLATTIMVNQKGELHKNESQIQVVHQREPNSISVGAHSQKLFSVYCSRNRSSAISAIAQYPGLLKSCALKHMGRLGRGAISAIDQSIQKSTSTRATFANHTHTWRTKFFHRSSKNCFASKEDPSEHPMVGGRIKADYNLVLYFIVVRPPTHVASNYLLFIDTVKPHHLPVQDDNYIYSAPVLVSGHHSLVTVFAQPTVSQILGGTNYKLFHFACMRAVIIHIIF